MNGRLDRLTRSLFGLVHAPNKKEYNRQFLGYRLPLGDITGEGLREVSGASRFQGGSSWLGLPEELRKELEAMGFDVVPRSQGLVGGVIKGSGGSSVPSQDLRFQTPRSSVPERTDLIRRVPLLLGGTVIRPPPLPLPVRAELLPAPASAPSMGQGVGERRGACKVHL